MEEAYAFLAGLGQAMAHPTRLHILEALARREACVCHLTALLGQRQAHVSQHLRVLKDAGLVTDRREGQMVYYRLADGRTAAVLSLLKDLSRSLDPTLAYPEPPAARIPGCPCPHCAPAPPLTCTPVGGCC
jgi:DNA-binding transcriptional ArsR family regulator